MIQEIDVQENVQPIVPENQEEDLLRAARVQEQQVQEN
jgi:hypothetical protein